MYLRLMTGAAALAFATLATRPANAWIKYCNGSSQEIFTIVHISPSEAVCNGETELMGWFNLMPNQCEIVSNVDVQQQPWGAAFQFYAQNDSGSEVWDSGNNASNITTCVETPAFNICDGACDPFSPQPPFFDVGFGGWWAGNVDNFTLTFN